MSKFWESDLTKATHKLFNIAQSKKDFSLTAQYNF